MCYYLKLILFKEEDTDIEKEENTEIRNNYFRKLGPVVQN